MSGAIRRRRGSVAGARDPHRRIEDWLIDGAGEALPRDVMVHALVCHECRRRIAAFDMLTAIELDRAGLPPRLARAEVAPARAGRRVTLAAGGAVTVSAAAVVAVAATGWRPPSLGDQGTVGSTAPTQAVLGNTGEPQATSAATSTVRSRPSRSAVASPGETVVGTPNATVPPVSARTPGPTPRPTATPHPTASPKPHTPTPSPSPSSSPTEAPTPTDTPTATPSL